MLDIKKIWILILICAFTSCKQKTDLAIVDGGVVLKSADENIVNSFNWAKKMALSFSHEGSDPVGYWYESALPGREAFCMRDISHQTIGGEIIGLSKHNYNMMWKFAQNISESKDWCTYWEINRYDKPAPVDYRNDKEFWYNLNANFDVIDACYRLYEWTGNSDYIMNEDFLYFYEKSLLDYIERWDLQPEKIMTRERLMNSPEPFNEKDPFHSCRGIPSYVESFPGIVVSVDLLATIYAGYSSAAKIAGLRGEEEKAVRYLNLANQYFKLINDRWWNNEEKTFNNFMVEGGEFHVGEGSTFALWFDATDIPERISSTLSLLIDTPTNVENMSYLPSILYSHNSNKEAYSLLMKMPYMERNEYPEVSYGVLEGIIGGMMGVEPEFSEKRISTKANLTEKTPWASIENLPIFGGSISLKHNSNSSSEMTNNTPDEIIWRAKFRENIDEVKVGKNSLPTEKAYDALGNQYSYIDISLGRKETVVCYK